MAKNPYTMQIAQRIGEMFADHVRTSDLSNSDKERPVKILTRCLAALGVYYTASCDEVAAAHAVFDGSDDGGIDAIHIDLESKCMVFVQSKWRNSGKGCPELADAIKFCSGIKALLALERERFPKLSKILWSTIDQALYSQGIRVKVCLIHTGSEEPSKHISKELDDLVAAFRSPSPKGEPSSLVSYEIVNLGAIYAFLSPENSTDPINIEFSMENWGLLEHPRLAYYGTISGLELKRLWAEHGDHLFRRNLRRRLKSPINNQITKTSFEEPSSFWYFNNGITITCDSATKSLAGGDRRDVGLFHAKNAAIVNGAQTVSSLGANEDEKKLSEVKILTRVIATGSDEDRFGDLVTRYNNYQNRIEPRDLMALEENQRRLRREVSYLGFDYKLQRGEFTSTRSVIDLEEATVALACCSDSIELAAITKRDKDSLWSDERIYRRIFNPSVSGIRLVHSVIFVRACGSWKTAQLNSAQESARTIILNHGYYFIVAFLWKLGKLSSRRETNEEFNAHIISPEFIDASGERLLRLIGDYFVQASNRFKIALGFSIPDFTRELEEYCNTNFFKEQVLEQGSLFTEI